ncbi:hypothetical protein KSD_65150 [Ktedonobacter sp. SOSP1-85]|uniref:hypothetical protein n=1 Tax=Ktedonobacter sp. SOSP1-85 TaxID=2778367 RepID=UPI001916AC09|nr:hypothetical protein [Ktedonobacter sp. SOSP1-85]GHO78744.1 hypothetical protein KSD_65150 [Ktedonobacter sp. SOSP1-85]
MSTTLNYAQPAFSTRSENIIKKDRTDLFVLNFMHTRLRCLLEQPIPEEGERQPWLHTLVEPNNRAHRIAIYRPDVLKSAPQLSFVGFVSQRRSQLPPCLVDEISRIDQELLVNVANVPSLVSYSSFALRPRLWYNLVLFQGSGLGTHLKGMAGHTYAAYELAPAYYDWIRLHQGMLTPASQDALQLHASRYYLFKGIQKSVVELATLSGKEQ